MRTSKNKIKSLMLALVLSVAAISVASARVCFLPDSTDCGEGDVVGGGNVEIPCQHSTCPAYNSKYQECYDERTYNNGGVNVTCKQIRCKLSKSECEAQEANANNSQCCNFDSKSGCYYMGSCPTLCNRDVYDSETDLGEDYNCTLCKDKNGTFYNCTPKDKECSDINSNYSTSCSDSQIAKEVTGIKDSNGNQCYTCESKPVGCTYEYRQATTADSCGLTDLNTNYQCMSTIDGCRCFDNLSKLSSVSISGGGIVTPINKISNKSATCVDENNVIRYQTICSGTPKSRCAVASNSFEFIPNGCVSDTYNNGFEVKGDEWGTCQKIENTCKYTYAYLTTSDTNASTKFDGSSELYRNFQNHKGNTASASYYYIGGENYYHAYNKISKDSNTCYNANNQLRYETICSGSLKQNCNTQKGKIFTHTCTSEEYNVAGLKIEGMEFGTCSCDTSKEEFDTKELCNSGTGKNCSRLDSNGCFATCAKVGLYDSEKECLDSAGQLSVTCTKVNDCYKKEIKGFLIRYAHGEKRNWRCVFPNNGSVATETHAWLAEIQPNVSYPGPILKTVEGIQYQDLPDNYRDATETYQYPAGTYYVCAGFVTREQLSTTRDYAVSLSKVGILYARDLNGSDPTQSKCFASSISSQYNNVGCEKNDYSGGHYICHKFTFEKGKLYLINFGYYQDSNYYTGGQCNNY